MIFYNNELNQFLLIEGSASKENGAAELSVVWNYKRRQLSMDILNDSEFVCFV